MNLVDLLEERRVDFKRAGEHHHVRDGFIGLDCPFCSVGTRRYRLGYNLAHGYFTCWTCGFHNAAETLALVLGVSRPEAGKLAAGLESVWTERRQKVKGRYKEPAGLTPLLDPHVRYLRSRGLDPAEAVRLWGAKALGVHARLPWRLWLPITRRGELVSWTTRSLAPKAARRYVNARPDEESVPAKDLLYGEDLVPGAAVVVVEGPLDVWRIGPGTVATMGSRVGAEQVRKIARYPNRLLCFDSEPDAQKRATALMDDLAVLPGATYNLVLDSKDAGEATDREVQFIRDFITKGGTSIGRNDLLR